jgi:uncharacterized membrane protein
MRSTVMLTRDAYRVEANVTIHREVADVFRFYRDFRNLPRFLGDVIAVEVIDACRSRWTIQGPLGIRVSWTIRVTEERADELIRYETVTAPTLKTCWEIRFAAGPVPGLTQVHELMSVPWGRAGRAALALIGKFPAAEVASNLRRLQELLEAGRVG